MTTFSLALGPAPADLYVDAALDAGTSYLIQNVSAGRRIFIAEAAVAPTPGETVAHVLVPGEYLIVTPPATGSTWVWSEGPAGAVLAITEAE